MVTAANRGKEAENAVKKKLVSLEASAFCHERLPDARAGSFKVALADFQYIQAGKFTLLEVKQVDHEFRLPHKNLDSSQIARLRMWKAAGSQAHVLVYHTPTKLWRVADISWFFLHKITESETGKKVGSWNLTDVPFITLDDYFRTFA